ncbi:hypothetical protein TNCV_1232741 [Trichonephila clavipes]|nr:hypothetical protein TNCV_1232741 [Trichonephila clavipes]
MKIGNNGNLVLGPFDEITPCLMNCQTKLRINHLTAVKSVAILETDLVELPVAPTRTSRDWDRLLFSHSAFPLLAMMLMTTSASGLPTC